MAGFADLNVVSETNKALIQEVLAIAFNLGYECVAVNNFIPELKSKGKGGEKQTVVVPPDEILLDEKICRQFKRGRRCLRQLSRFTTVIDDPAKAARLSSPEVQAYDLVAVEPTSEKTFHLACGTLDIDIISLNMVERLPFYVKRPSINLALDRGIFFEIKYAPTIRDSTARRNTIAAAQSLVEVCKGKNVIVSSGSEKAMELRAPYDVMNLNLLFGLSPAQAKDSVSTNCRRILKHAEARKMRKCAIQIMQCSSLSVTDVQKDKRKRKSEIPVDNEDDQYQMKKCKDT
ncbi:ribonuclease P protein subunit p30-like [Gigantopelta aegis]|uniref:ribonuclease P protein subunit p30-like n=1 Tax=Gigantopelta aegis TaxID=1735272 RepID=UPI001B8875C6|nr:ribonuclease P protein subunit p30-like [Gigantopelta aegis]